MFSEKEIAYLKSQRFGQRRTRKRIAGGALYLVGSLLVTVVFNVPKNNALASVAPADPDGASQWTDYLSKWTAWNHVRAAAALAAAASLTIALSY